MRLIDADAFLEKMMQTSRYFDVKFDIAQMPTIDAVPVVRCEDCRHRIYKDMGEDFGEVGGCEIFNAVFACDFFCGYGERKEGAD